MDDLVRWLGEQLDEDERIARDAAKHAAAALATADRKAGAFQPPYDGSQWSRDHDHVFVVESRLGRRRVVQIADCGSAALTLTPHIAAHDPARVLREIEAKRQIVEQHRPVGYGDVCLSYCHTRTPSQPQTWPCLTLRLLAAPYADRPGYREEWRS